MTNFDASFRGMKLLANLRRRMEFLLIIITVCLILIAFAYIFSENETILDTLITLLLLCLGILLWMIALFCKKIMLAKLIFENRIMYIRQAKIITTHNTPNTKKELQSSPEVFVSCFGVLIDTKVIKFNIDKVQLKAIELRENYITMTYGKGQKNETMRIFHETTSAQEMIRIAETFRYETGVIPVLVDDK